MLLRTLGRSLKRTVSYRRLSTASASPSISLDEVLTSRQEQLLLSALSQVPEHGWTRDAIAAAVPPDMSVALSAMVEPTDLVSFAMRHYSQHLRDELSGQKDEELPQSPRARAKHAIRTRLSYLSDLMTSSRWHEAMAMGATQRPLQTREQLHELVDIIADYVNQGEDGSISSSQHLGLGAVYVSTELFMLTDVSPDYQDTWAFLDQALKQWEHGSSVLPSSAMLSTASTVATALGSGVASLLQLKTTPHEHLWRTIASLQNRTSSSGSSSSQK